MTRTNPTICMCFRYADAPAAIDFLVKAFGFEATMVVPDEDGRIAHAQLRFGPSMIMLGSLTGDETQGNTTSASVVVDDPDAHCERARAAGAKITMEPQDQPYGGRLYSCLDLEGHGWHFGSYDPFAPVG